MGLGNGTTIDRMEIWSFGILKPQKGYSLRKMRLEMYFAIGHRLFGL
jgi:hypothetical protein